MNDGEVDANIPSPERDVQSNIIGSIWVSSWLGAKNWNEGKRICVHHDTSLVLDYHMPILLTRPSDEDRNKGAIANTKQLDLLAEVIDSCLKAGEPLMVHCKGGVERSPLTIVYYFNKFRQFSIDDAYAMVRESRPVVEDRRSWLTNGLENT